MSLHDSLNVDSSLSQFVTLIITTWQPEILINNKWHSPSHCDLYLSLHDTHVNPVLVWQSRPKEDRFLLWYSNSLGIASQDKLWLTANSQVLSRYLRRTNSDNIIVHLWVVFIHAEEKLDTRDIHSSYKIMFNVSILNDLFCSFLLLFTRGFKWVEDKRVVFSVYAHLLLQLK